MPTPCTVSGNLQTLTGNQIAQGRVNFQLTNIGSGNPIGVLGTSIFPAITLSVLSSPDGSFSIALWGNDNINPANTLYAVTYCDSHGNEIGPVIYSITGVSANLNTLSAVSATVPPVFATLGSFTLAIVLENANFTANLVSALYLVTTGVGTITATLPSAATASQVIILKKVDSGVGTVVLTPIGGQKIDGLSTFTLSAQFQFMGLVSDGSNWQIFTRN